MKIRLKKPSKSQVIIAYTIKYFGAVIFTIFMIAKIIPQVLLSYFLYDGDFEVGGWVGIGVVFAGLVLKIAHKLTKILRK